MATISWSFGLFLYLAHVYFSDVLMFLCFQEFGCRGTVFGVLGMCWCVLLGPGCPPWMPRQGRECLSRQGCECLPGQGLAGVQVQLWLQSVLFLFALSSTSHYLQHKGHRTRAVAGLGSYSCHGPMEGDIAQAPVTPVLLAVGFGSPSLRAAGIPCHKGRLRVGYAQLSVVLSTLERSVSCTQQLRGPRGDTDFSGSVVLWLGKQNLLRISALVVWSQLGLKPDLEGTSPDAPISFLAGGAACSSCFSMHWAVGWGFQGCGGSQDLPGAHPVSPEARPVPC